MNLRISRRIRVIMKRLIFLTAVAAMLGMGLSRPASAFGPDCGCQYIPWHGMYYSPAVGVPQALVVPPTVHCQAHLSSTTAGTRVSGIRAKFKAIELAPGVYDPRGFYPTPRWPSSTDQLGTYYVRAPRR